MNRFRGRGRLEMPSFVKNGQGGLTHLDSGARPAAVK